MTKSLSASLLALGLLFSTSAFADDGPGPLRLGIGGSAIKFQGAPNGISTGKSMTHLLFAEFAQNNHTATRLTLYRLDSNNKKMHGAETQLLLGYGLAKPGIRLYTGPTWHMEHMHLPPADQSKKFYGFGWQAGLGWQYKSITLDYSFGMRDTHRYNKKMRKLGYDIDHVFQNNLLLSYKF